jgi:hypothetical protein
MDMFEQIPRWDDEPEDPETYWQRKLEEARAADEGERQEHLHQQLIDSGQVSIGRPCLVPRPDRTKR